MAEINQGKIMTRALQGFLRCVLALFCAVVVTSGALAQRIGEVSTSVDNLMVVLREWRGGNKQDETLKPTGPVWTTFDGKNVTMELAWYHFLGDMQVRFVFDTPISFRNATAEEFAHFRLSPAEAVQRAVANIERVYGKPHTEPYQDGLMYIRTG